MTPAPDSAEPSIDSTLPKLLGRITWLLWAIVIALAVAFCFFADSLCVTLLLAGFLAILADPVVTYLERWKLGRSLSAGLIVVSSMIGLMFLVYASYNRASQIIDDIPLYAGRIRGLLLPLNQKIEQVQESAQSLNPQPPAKKVAEVKVREPVGWLYAIRGVGPLWGAVIIIGVVPFLTFFYLVRKKQMYERMALSVGTAVDVRCFSDRLVRMVRAFAIGNLIIGTGMAVVMVIMLLALHMEGAVIIGTLSGFLNLIPFLGLLLAVALPLCAALLQFNTAAPFLIICATTSFLHIITNNLLVPKFIGPRVDIGPVASTAGILFWGWLWGPIGVLLAIPLTATIKLIADCHPGLIHVSNLLANSPRSVPAWVNRETFYRVMPYLRPRGAKQ